MKDPPDGAATPSSLEIEIDPSLIEAAVAAVEQRGVAGPVVPEAEPAEAPTAPQRPTSVDDQWAALLQMGELQGRIEALEGEVARARGESEKLDAQLQETRKLAGSHLADFERFRSRSRKDNEEAERKGEERARVYDADDPQQILSGLRMIVEQFRRQLLRVGMERIEIVRGSAFDPEIHEAVAHVPDADVPEGAVLEEVSAGFRLRGRLFRPSRVTVASRLLSDRGDLG